MHLHSILLIVLVGQFCQSLQEVHGQEMIPNKTEIIFFHNQTREYGTLVIDSDGTYPFTIQQTGRSFLIPCILPTHPNVTVSLIHYPLLNDNVTPNEVEEFGLTEFIKEPTEISLDGSDSRSFFNPKEGAILRKQKVSDVGRYKCVGKMNNVTQEIPFSISVRGVELNRIGDLYRDAPLVLVGSNVSLICRTFDFNLKWFYFKNSKKMEINEANPPKGMQVRSRTINRSKNRKEDFTASRLDLVGITRDSPRTFRCEANYKKNTS